MAALDNYSNTYENFTGYLNGGLLLDHYPVIGLGCVLTVGETFDSQNNILLKAETISLWKVLTYLY